MAQLVHVLEKLEHTLHRLDHTLQKLNHTLNKIDQNEEKIMASLDDAIAEIQAESTQIDGVSTMIDAIKQQLTDALAGANLPPAVQTKIDAVFSGLQSNSGKLATALGTAPGGGGPLPPTDPGATPMARGRRG